ncbi:phosphatidylglycerophosphatase A [Viridibacillus arvi]|uniref:phosphatidylglycerophosphatase A n=1 Tax=Viridibacillus arvi TaxID=263475 RepID=UPI0034CF2F4B
MNQRKRYTVQEMNEYVTNKLEERGVRLTDIAVIVYMLEQPYTPDIKVKDCIEHVKGVLEKREVLHAVLTGIALDEFAEKELLPEPLQSLVETDDELFGIDEILPLSIINMYGCSGLTTFGNLVKEKVGVIMKLDSMGEGKTNTFLKDLIAGIAAVTASKLAHIRKDMEEQAI